MGGFQASIITQGQNKVPTFDELRAQFEQAKIQKQQMAMNQQAIAEGQQGMQIKAMQLDQAKKADAQQTEALGYLQKNQGDVDKTIADLVKSGNPQAFVFQQHKGVIADQALKTQELQDKIAKSKQEQDAANAGHVASLTAGIADLPPELQGLQYKTNRAIAIQHGYAKPEDLPEEWSPQTAQIVQGLGQNALSVKDQIEGKQKAQAQAETQRHNVTEESLTGARDLSTSQNQQATLAETKSYHGIEAKQRQQQIGIEGMNAQTSRGQLGVAQARLGLAKKENQQQFGDPLQNLSGAQLDMAKKYASGDFKLPPAGSRAPGAQAIRQAALALNPNLSDDTFTVKHDFNDPSKPGGKNLATMARIAGHIGRFEKNSGAMGTLESGAYGMGATLTGNQKATAEDAHAIAAELEKLTSGGVGSQSQTQGWQTALKSSSAAVRQKAVNEISQIIGSQFEGMNAQYKAQTQQDLPLDKYVSPAGREWLKKNNINVSGTAEAPKVSQAAQPPAHIQSLREKYKY
jgi:hypothetical protein